VRELVYLLTIGNGATQVAGLAVGGN
jgi:hypothetical protein